MKKRLKPGTMLSPVPAVMVSCGTGEEKNIITIAWTGIINSDPPMTYVSIRKSRHSHALVSQSKEFVINLVTEELSDKADYCGVKSGGDEDKFSACELTAIPASEVRAPLIKESPVNLECRVTEIKELGSHDMFIAEIVAVHADEELFDEEGRIRLDRAGLIAYNHGEYFGIKRSPLGKFGFSVMKPKTAKRLRREAQERRQLERSKDREVKRREVSGKQREESLGERLAKNRDESRGERLAKNRDGNRGERLAKNRGESRGERLAKNRDGNRGDRRSEARDEKRPSAAKRPRSKPGSPNRGDFRGKRR